MEQAFCIPVYRPMVRAVVIPQQKASRGKNTHPAGVEAQKRRNALLSTKSQL